MNESVELNESLRADYLILGFADEGRRAEDGLFGLLDTGFWVEVVMFVLSSLSSFSNIESLIGF